MTAVILSQSTVFAVGPDVTVNIRFPDGVCQKGTHQIKRRMPLALLVGRTAVEAGRLPQPGDIQLCDFKVKAWNRHDRIVDVEFK